MGTSSGRLGKTILPCTICKTVGKYVLHQDVHQFVVFVHCIRPPLCTVRGQEGSANEVLMAANVRNELIMTNAALGANGSKALESTHSEH